MGPAIRCSPPSTMPTETSASMVAACSSTAGSLSPRVRLMRRTTRGSSSRSMTQVVRHGGPLSRHHLSQHKQEVVLGRADAGDNALLGTNSHHYKFGNDYRATAWADTTSIRGSRRRLRSVATATATSLAATRSSIRSRSRPGTRTITPARALTCSWASKPLKPKGALKGARVSLEGGVPVIQLFDGPQPKMDWMASLNASVYLRRPEAQPTIELARRPRDAAAARLG